MDSNGAFKQLSTSGLGERGNRREEYGVDCGAKILDELKITEMILRMNIVAKNGHTGLVRRRPDFSRQLSEQILELIDVQELQPGDRLPSMKQLAADFAVATPTIREALRQLQAVGMVDIRHGSGVYVKNASPGIMIANPHFGDVDATIVLQLLEARMHLEPELTSLAAVRASVDDIHSLESILEEAEQLLEGHDSELHSVNMSFHQEIARLSGNRILSQMFNSLIDLYAHEQLGILTLFNARVRDYRDHILIFDAIRNHEADRARDQMRSHLQDVFTVVEERLKSE